jgi:hypothetical protein
VSTPTETEYMDPARNLRAATGRVSMALDAIEDPEATNIAGRPNELEALESIEKAHYRLERAQRSLVEAMRAREIPWDQIAGPLGMTAAQARRRFTDAAWLGRS